MAEEKRQFQTEVARLLHIVANSLYSEKQIFLRELISNASDACDRLRYEALTHPELTADDPEFRVRLSVDKKGGILEVADNGIGMNREMLIDDLGTIARSGTTAYMEQLTGDAKKDMAVIGQFGVGFYSVFMVADSVEVISRRAGEDKAWRWQSDGSGEFTVGEAEREGRGTTVRLHLRKTEKEFLEPERLRHIVKTYSDHIALPIVMAGEDGDETLNAASALWTLPKRDITDEQYKEFYHHVGHAFDDPWLTLHWRAEGKLEYTNLLFIPSIRPFDIFDPQRRHRVKLYVRRVFITDECEELIPGWLRFMRGLVDSEDLPLNISRETLQNNPILGRMRGAIVKRVLNELGKKADKSPDEFATFWNSFGIVMKEGIYEDADYRDDLLKLARFRSTHGDGWTSLEEYESRKKDGQKAIYYITGDSREALEKSPQLEGFRARGIEVLLLTDPVDEFWTGAVPAFGETPFKSVTRAGSDLSDIAVESEDKEAKSEPPADSGALDKLIAQLKLTLDDAVKDVRVSHRLTDSAVCLTSDEGDLDIHMERLLKQHGQVDTLSKRILEINAAHPLIRALSDEAARDGAGDALDDAAWLLLDQARILEGDPVPDPTAFARRMSDAMARGLDGALIG